MIIIGRSVDQPTALSIWQNGLTSAVIRTMTTFYDNMSSSENNTVSCDNVINKGYVWAAKHRYELSKFFKTHGNTVIHCNGSLSVIKDSYKTVDSSALAFIRKQIKSAYAPFGVFGNNVKHIVRPDDRSIYFHTTAFTKHEITKKTLSEYGYFILIFPSAWAQGHPNLPAPFMINANFNFLALSGLLGPSISGIKDQTGKAKAFDYFYIDQRLTKKQWAEIKENQF